ncbi:MAG: FtsW/RodA/SpoVE family cell cycle protein [Bacilli bacterium]
MKQITKKFRHNLKDLDKPLLIITICLFIFGLLNIVTASSSESVTRYNTSLYYYFFKQLQMLSIGLVLTVIIINMDTKNYKLPAVCGFIGIILLLIYLSIAGSDTRGSRNWLKIFGFTFQPSEFAKPIIIVCLGLLFELFYKKLRNKKINHRPLIGIILMVGLLIPVIVFLQKDFGTSVILLGIFGVLFLASPIYRIEKGKTIVLLIVLSVIGGGILINQKGYILNDVQMNRFDFYNPCQKYETGGYQICNGFIALNEGGLFGVGIAKSTQKYSYIPEPHTDSVFAIIGEEYGLIRCGVIFLLFIVILKRILFLAAHTETIRGKYFCLGIATYIFMHIFINLGGLFGLIPLTGVPLPFLSYGGSFTISLICSLAIVQRVAIENKNQKIKI